ncbi:MAG TPA: extracellular solute-binding protein [Spirochaetia bacterium]|nr:extracellular solute-binding protein [Spirochaetia bacterium]
MVSSNLRIKTASVLLAVLLLLVGVAPVFSSGEKETTAVSGGQMLAPMDGVKGPFAGGGWRYPTQPVKISVWWHEYAPFTAYEKELIQRYQTLHPNVSIETLVASQADVNQKVTVALASGTGPNILDQDISFFAAYYDKGVLEPINLQVFGGASLADIQKEYIGTVINGVTFGGNIYGLPYQTNSMSYVHNIKAYKEAGMSFEKDQPKTWADMVTVGSKLKKVEGGKTVRKGYEFPYQSKRWELQAFQPMVEQEGGTILSADNTKANLDSDPAVKAMTTWRDLTKAVGDPNYALATASDPNVDFIDGRTAIWYTGPWATSQLIDRMGKPYEDWGFTSMAQVNPQKPTTMIYGFTWGVNKDKSALEKQVSWDFVRFMLARPEEWLQKASFIQPRSGLLETESAKSFPYISVHLNDVATGNWYVRSVHTNELVDITGRAIERVIFQGTDPKASLTQANQEANKILDGK